jgi:hypothetical protein
VLPHARPHNHALYQKWQLDCSGNDQNKKTPRKKLSEALKCRIAWTWLGERLNSVAPNAGADFATHDADISQKAIIKLVQLALST